MIEVRRSTVLADARANRTTSARRDDVVVRTAGGEIVRTGSTTSDVVYPTIGAIIGFAALFAVGRMGADSGVPVDTPYDVAGGLVGALFGGMIGFAISRWK